MADYGDVETLLIAWLKTRFVTNNVIDELPYNVTFVMPLIVVERYGGPRRRGTDTATVDIDVFRENRVAAKSYANEVARAIEMELPGYTAGLSHVSGVRNVTGPTIAPWENNRNIRRATFAYEITMRTRL